MSTIAIVRSTNNARADQVLAGIYGHMIPGASEGDAAKFTIAAELRPVSVLFGYLENGSSPVRPSEMVTVDVPDQMVNAVQAQLLRSLQTRWKTMYENLAPGGSDLIQTMIRGEGASVGSAIAAHFAARDLREWRVPVLATMITDEVGGQLANPETLMKSLNQDAASMVEIDATGYPVLTAAAPPAETALVADAGTQAPVDTENTQTPAWGAYEGVEARVKGFTTVMATSAAGATAIAQTLLNIAQDRADQGMSELFRTQVVPTEVLSTRDRELYNDGSEHDHEDDDSTSRGDRGDYNFES